jgi:pyruvate ferredoxin oxidoreductase delta subunit
VPKPESEMTWRDLNIGCIADEPGSARAYRTGDWRSQRPVYEFSRCIKCGMCQLFCPEGCIKMNELGYFEADLYHCKGCGICARECPTYVVSMVEEE